VGSLLLFSYKLDPLTLILSYILIVLLLYQNFYLLPLSHVLSCALSCASFVTSICDKILVDNKESFREILVHWKSSWCAIGVVEVIYFHFASCFAFTRLYVEI
jgi:hypothetical protein